MKKSLLILLFVCILITFSGCYSGYSGEHNDLFTVAINSILWTSGWSIGAEAKLDPEITILEQDPYGRVLFEYSESLFTANVSFSSLVVMQHCDKNVVYYYEDINFISKEKKAYATVSFDEDDINCLKASNDWNKPLNLDNCVAKTISTQKAILPIDNQQLNNLFTTYEGYSSSKTTMLTYDNYGRFICYSTIWTENSGIRQEHHVVILFQKDFSFAIFEPQNLFHYQQELKVFKCENNWNCAN
ncbi:MAG: hypothetical protein IJF66_03540 [Clostridia bacterium]|nr:hypothetical protein [Clostridia bacterium]